MNISNLNRSFRAILSALILVPSISWSFETPKKPRLILQVTIDQLRGDMMAMVLDRCEPGGFRYLTENGTWHTDAHHPHANTETIVGHVTLATGAYPSRHGMVGNVWFDREDDRLRYNIEDANYDSTGGVGARDMDSEVDTSQVSKSEGRSPSTILTSTISDEIALFFGDQSKIFAVSGKDRGAVSMAGHVGKAFWYTTRDGGFASSTYYYNQFPEWVKNWNAQKKADEYYEKNWQLSRDLGTYRYGDQDDRAYENPADLGFGRVFPHPYGDRDNKYYYTLLLASPVVDELTVDFSKSLITAEQIGQDDIPDYLAISLSVTDYVGHLFGPASLETEDNLLRLDRTLADLFSYIDKEVGLEHTLIVVSADHGAPEAPEYMIEKGFKAGRINLDTLDYSELDQKLNERFGLGKEVIKLTYHPYIYLDHALIKEKEVNLTDVSHFIAHELIAFEGIGYAIPTDDLISGKVPDAPISRQVLNNFNPGRSGDIYMIYQPHWTVTGDKDVALINHGSPWRYDTYVPIIFTGPSVPGQRVQRSVETVDIAPTLSVYLGIKPPSGSIGKPLVEVLSN